MGTDNLTGGHCCWGFRMGSKWQVKAITLNQSFRKVVFSFGTGHACVHGNGQVPFIVGTIDGQPLSYSHMGIMEDENHWRTELKNWKNNLVIVKTIAFSMQTKSTKHLGKVMAFLKFHLLILKFDLQKKPHRSAWPRHFAGPHSAAPPDWAVPARPTARLRTPGLRSDSDLPGNNLKLKKFLDLKNSIKEIVLLWKNYTSVDPKQM